MMALTALVLADRGLLDLDAPVSQYWPEFAQNGKDLVTLATVLRHEAGLHQLNKTITLDDVQPEAIKVSPANM